MNADASSSAFRGSGEGKARGSGEDEARGSGEDGARGGGEVGARGSGNGWVRCSFGHRHWGRFGAAGLLITDGSRVLLQHRSAWTHEGDTWAVPGGARDRHEEPITAALREAAEETSLDLEAITPFAEWVDDHGGWAYNTILASASGELEVRPTNFESAAIKWWPIAEVDRLRLHYGFASTWPALRRILDA